MDDIGVSGNYYDGNKGLRHNDQMVYKGVRV